MVQVQVVRSPENARESLLAAQYEARRIIHAKYFSIGPYIEKLF